jgi:hypothetical protein
VKWLVDFVDNSANNNLSLKKLSTNHPSINYQLPVGLQKNSDATDRSQDKGGGKGIC